MSVPAQVPILLSTFEGDGKFIAPENPPVANQGDLELKKDDLSVLSVGVSVVVGLVVADITDVDDNNGEMIVSVFARSTTGDAVLLGSATSSKDGLRETLQVPLTDPGTPAISTMFPGALIVTVATGSKGGDYYVHRLIADASVTPGV